MNSQPVLLALRLVHVVAGVLWVGAAAMLVGFVRPAARGADDGVGDLGRLIRTRDLPRYLNALVGLTLLSGLAMYGWLAWLTRGAWVVTRNGAGLGLGGLAALTAAGVATWVAAPAVHCALDLGDRVRAAGPGAPDAAVARASLERARSQYARAMGVVTALLVAAAAAMAVARYLG